MKVQRHFAEINADKSLTEADKKQLKDFYLQDLIAPKARSRSLEMAAISRILLTHRTGESVPPFLSGKF